MLKLTLGRWRREAGAAVGLETSIASLILDGKSQHIFGGISNYCDIPCIAYFISIIYACVSHNYSFTYLHVSTYSSDFVSTLPSAQP